MNRTRLLITGLAILVFPFVATFVYLNVIRSEPLPPLTLDDVSTTTAGPGDAAAAGIEGTWTVVATSVVGYRVQETLFGQRADAVGRSSSVTGSIRITGTQVTEGGFEVDMATFSSDESRRDSQFNGRIMQVDQFPTATFVLTAPIELGAVPDDGAQITAAATGDLTLHGMTRSVTIPLTAARNGATMAVDGTISVTFSDYGIGNPSGGPAQVGDTGELELLLVLGR